MVLLYLSISNKLYTYIEHILKKLKPFNLFLLLLLKLISGISYIIYTYSSKLVQTFFFLSIFCFISIHKFFHKYTVLQKYIKEDI